MILKTKFLDFDSNYINSVISKKKYFLTVKEKLFNLKEDLEMLKLIECD